MKRTVKKPDVRRQEIIQAARHLFLAQNYEHTTMQSVVDYLGIAKGTIYHYFKFKEELLEAVVEDLVNEDYQHKHEILGQINGNALEKIRKLLELETLAVRHEGLLDKLHQPGNIALHTRLLAFTIVKEATLYAQLLEQGCKEGLFQTDSPLECAEFMISGIQFLTDIGVYPWPQEDLLRRVKAFPRLLENMLKAPTGSFAFLVDRFL